MATDGLPALATWAEVDPVRYPFDPDEVPTVMPPLVTDDRLGWITDRIPSRAEVPVAGTLDERFDDWPPPTTAVVTRWPNGWHETRSAYP